MATLAIAFSAGCARTESVEIGTVAEDVNGLEAARVVLEREVARIDTAAAAADSIFQPLPLLTPVEQEGLRRYGNDQHLARARALGFGRNLPTDSLRVLEASGRVVRLEDSEYWVVRDLDYSQPLVVPEVVDVLREIGARFHRRLGAIGAPAFRFEISSVTRTAADQERLRRANPNAASGESAHEYGTTVDVLYSAYAAPQQAIVPIDTGGAEWVEPFLLRYAALAAERVAARRALELQAILGHVLLELQNEGRILVTLERQQPVFHFTVAR